MKITTIDELKQKIGKFIVFSKYDENCNDKCATMKLLTRIKNPGPWFERAYPNRKGFYGYEIWGKFTANFKQSFQPFTIASEGRETYSNCYVYARDPTEQELKQFRQQWRLKRYYESRKK